MRTPLRTLFTLTAALLLTAVATDTTGCAALPSTTACTGTAFISPTTVTLDHTIKGSGNAQTFNTGYTYSGSCAIPAILIAYNWNVSDTINATVSSTGVVSCVNASLAPITVYSSITSYSGNPLVASNTPTNLPTATLICK